MLPPINGLLTHHAIAVPVIHVDVCGMSGVDGGDAVPACLGAGDAAVAVVVIALEGTGTSFTWRDWDRRRNGSRTEVVDVHGRRCTPRQDAFQHVSFTRVDGEGIALADLDDAARKPAVRPGSHSAASFPLFWERLTAGLARVRLSRSPAN